MRSAGKSDGYFQWTASIDDIVLIGPAGTVRAAIDAYLAPEQPRRAWFDAGLARVRGRYDAWTVARRQVYGGPEREIRFELEWSGGVRLDAKPSADVQVLAASPEQAQAVAGFLRDSIANDWRREASRLWKTAAESVRISVENRVVRVAGEMDWEPVRDVLKTVEHDGWGM